MLLVMVTLKAEPIGTQRELIRNQIVILVNELELHNSYLFPSLTLFFSFERNWPAKVYIALKTRKILSLVSFSYNCFFLEDALKTDAH